MSFLSNKPSTATGPLVSETDAQLVHQAVRGDKKAFVAIVSRYQGMVCGICLGILNDFPASEDAAQDAFVSAWMKIGELRDAQALKPWLGQIARNAALAHVRQRRGHASLDETVNVAHESPSPAETAASMEEAEMVRNALSKLPENYRLPLVLFYREGQSIREVAQILEISEETMRQRLSRGREMLRENMTGLVERVITRTGPTSIFTIGVAAAIGAMLTPTAVAGTAFVTGAKLSSIAAPVSHSGKLIALMSATKNVLIVSLLVTAISIPAGYKLSQVYSKQKSRSAVASRVAKPIADPDFESSLLAEWRQLHATYGSDAAAMPRLFDAISKLIDASRRLAFRGALLSEWLQVDAQGAFAFFDHEGDNKLRLEFVRQWLKIDPHGVATLLLTADKKWDYPTRESLMDFARLSPSEMPALVEHLPVVESPWGSDVSDGFAVLAKGSLVDAVRAAEQLKGPNRNQAISGVARTWAQVNLEEAIAWSRNLPPGIDSNEVIRNALIGRAFIDPAGAMEQIGLVPEGGRNGFQATTTGARVITEAVKSHFEETLSWLASHPGKFSYGDLEGIYHEVSKRMQASAPDFLNARVEDGTLPTVAAALASYSMNSDTSQKTALLKWLQTQPVDQTTSRITSDVMRDIYRQDPVVAMNLVKDFPKDKSWDDGLGQIVGEMVHAKGAVENLNKLLADMPERLHGLILQKAFQNLSPENLSNPKEWVSRLPSMSEPAYQIGAEQLAQAWVVQDPASALEFVNGLSGAAHILSLEGAVRSWMSKNPSEATSWITSLPEGLDKDRAIRSLVVTTANQQPEKAWQWVAKINHPTVRLHAAWFTTVMLSKRNQGLARQNIEASDFAPEIKIKLIDSIVNSDVSKFDFKVVE